MTYTENRPTVFECIDIDARVGDYFKLPYQPSVVILSRIDLGDYVTFLVQSGKNQPEQWDIMKPEVELAEQERNRVEADEEEMSAVIHSTVTEEFELYLASSYDWLTEPIGSNPDAIFGKPDWVVCHECNGEGCEYCNYGGIITELKPLPYTFAPLPKEGDFRFQPTEGTKGVCNVLLHGEIIGYIEKIRNKKEFWVNTPNSYYWESEGVTFSNPLDAANHILAVNSKAA